MFSLHRFAAMLLPLATVSLPGVALAQEAMTAIAEPAQPTAISLGTGRLPDAQNGESWHMQYGSHFARNVVEATLTPFLPEDGRGSGAAVIVAPGGGFITLSMENEGWDVARALAARGVAAFVLKYRLRQSPGELAAFDASMRTVLTTTRIGNLSVAEAAANSPAQLADSRAAFALVRARAGEWGVDPDRIGMIGFSAGAMLTMATYVGVDDARPAFLGNIYGPMAAMPVPADAPPMFVALAADDPLFAGGGFGIVESWRNAGRPVEFHLYEQGGHGFGMYQKTTTSTGWFPAFADWLWMHGFLTRRD
ncbi:alpha/beta hydrolase [Alteraurantiacibacter buctensis]|uniref:Alpha/beta hydrolase fold domain-containing protein n=1 Tax=Alteraurantiacibacter buctensis TaxID=1503981 RepID=A0A844Z406_9SPHN|nr:alpha/beta hydrolase fold domain-containing protein [Alteraurantiacibacter buctensis]